MNIKWLIVFVANCLCAGMASASLHWSDDWKQSWRPVMGVGGGISSAYALGQAQTFPIVNPVTDSFYQYTPQNRSQTQGLFEFFLGGEHILSPQWRMQPGLAYDETSSFTVQGQLTQGADIPSADQYHYQYKVLTRQILAQSKLMYVYREKYYPYFLLGLGGALNTAAHYTTTVPPFLTFTRLYDRHVTGSFAYRVGAGVDMDIHTHVRLGVSYRFANLGGAGLGSARIDTVSVNGTLSQNNLYANEVLFQLSYII